ncbi:hypothetical protein D3C76_1038250 [compost metagenome]
MLAQRRQVEVPLLAPGHHVRVHLDHHRTLRVAGQRGVEHALEIGSSGALQRGIAAGLIGHQHARLRQHTGLDPRAVVLGYTLLTPTCLQGTRTQHLGLGQRQGNQLFEARRAAGVVIDAQRVDDQRQRRVFSTQAHRAQKTVFDRNQRQPGSIGSRLCT